jgi:hypothetical protein
MSRIDPVRQLRRLRRSEPDRADAPDEVRSTLPVPVGPARTLPPSPETADGGAAFSAQLLGQGGERRGLKGGATVLDTAKAVYNRTEYSGKNDRRARKGRITKTEV